MVILLVNSPIPVPSTVFVLSTVGIFVVLQHTPRAITGTPPSSVISPPENAELFVISVAIVVVNVGTLSVVKLSRLP